jgi:hypothetical protein
MSQDDKENSTIYKVVVNQEELKAVIGEHPNFAN